MSAHTPDDVLVLLGGFTDTEPTYGPEDFEAAWFGTGAGDVQGGGTLRDYYLETTDGEIALNSGPAGVRGWYETDMDSGQIDQEGETWDPTDNNFLDFSPHGSRQFVRKVIDQADDDVDFQRYDNDGDGCVAVVVVFQEIQFREHAFTTRDTAVFDFDKKIERDGVVVGGYARLQEVDGNGNVETIGTPAHEIGHLYGLPDLYDEVDGDHNASNSPGIGIWGLMGTGNGGQMAGDPGESTPVHMTAWSKIELLEHPNPRIDNRHRYRTRMPRRDRPGIVPAAAEHHEYYRIEPRCHEAGTCEEYYLVSYRKRTGFDRGLQTAGVVSGDHLKIWRVDDDGEWRNDFEIQPNLLTGTTRLDGRGTQPFAAGSDPVATVDGRDSGVRLENFDDQYGVATFNDPPQRHLEADEQGVYAIAVGTTLPDGTEVGTEWMVDHRVAIEGTTNMTIYMGRNLDLDRHPARTERGKDFLQIKESQDGLEDGLTKKGVKVIHEADRPTNYIFASTYPTFPLPSAMTLNVTGGSVDPTGDRSTVRFEVNLTNGGRPYEYGQFGSPDADHFTVTVGGVEVDSGDVEVTERAQHLYVLEVTRPENASGYDVAVTFNESKAGVSHEVSASGNAMEPVLREMSGTGTADDPYVVTDATQLHAVRADKDGHFELGRDLSLSTENWNDGEGFDPIGKDPENGTAFSGTFDGQGHTISGLTIDRENENTVGLFGNVTGGTIRNVRLESVTVRGGGVTGGLAGELEGGRVVGSSVSGTVTGGIGVGGLVGSVGEDSVIRRSHSTGRVTGEGAVGGIAGGLTKGTIVRSYSTADVNGTGDDSGAVGGLVGNFHGGVTRGEFYEGHINESFATGDVSGNENVGGLVGYNMNGQVNRSYATGNVTGQRNVGGLVGHNFENAAPWYDLLVRSYATGRVTGDEAAGGLVGYGAGMTNLSYYDVEATGRDDWCGDGDCSASIGSVIDGLETNQMHGRAAERNMEAFDFEDTWATRPDDYPQLQWVVTEPTSGTVDTRTTSNDGTATDDEDDVTVDVETPGLGVGQTVIAVGVLIVGGLLYRRRRSP